MPATHAPQGAQPAARFTSPTQSGHLTSRSRANSGIRN